MMRTQIQLTREQYQGLRKWAARLEISLSEAVRRCVDEKLSRPEHAYGRDHLVRQAFSVCEKYADPDGGGRVAKDHDAHLAKAYRR